MSAPACVSEHPSASARWLWITSLMLFASVLICYIDRSNLAVAAPLLKVELELTPAKLGTLLSAFFWSYACCQLGAGWLVDRFNVNRVLAGGFFLWTLATAATGLVGSFAALFALRLLLGVGESVAYPAYAKIFATCYNEGQRGLANSLIDVGCKCGPALGTFAGGTFMAAYGWRPFFLLLGMAALPWLPCWIRWMPRGWRQTRSVTGADGPGVLEILGRRSAWATFLGLFAGNYFWYFLLNWLPYYLVHERHFSMETMAVAGSVPFLCSAASTSIAGWLSYRALAAGASPTRVRKTCTVAGLGGAGVIAFVPLCEDFHLAMALLILASVCYGVFSTSPWAIAQTIAGPQAAGRWAGWQNFIGNLSGVAAAAVTGFVVDRTGNFVWPFALTAAVAVAGAIVYLLMLGPVEPAKWRHQASS
ncbi:MAG TPA: MFS transporter [Candidatus Didemnitutus sp.]|jgi:MFS family permease